MAGPAKKAGRRLSRQQPRSSPAPAVRKAARPNIQQGCQICFKAGVSTDLMGTAGIEGNLHGRPQAVL
eukprot:364557-Chlamydomonas_euryale.AAC.8